MPISLDGKRLHVTSTAANGVVNAKTVFEFTQQGSLVWARYAGGRIALGYLVGRIDGDRLVFRYAQTTLDGRLDGGQSNCEIVCTPDGRLRLLEHFQWESRDGTGTNVFDELPD